MKRTWMPRAAGILCIIAGTIGLIVGIAFILVVLILMGYPLQAPSIDLDLLPLVVYFIVIIIAIFGGQYALKRRSWGWALAGAICALVPVVIPGILAIIFVVLGKGEFKAKALVAYERGDAYDETGEYGKAIASYSKAIELDPNHALSYYNRGCAYGEIGEYEKAIADYSKAIELNPGDADTYYNRGLAYQEKGELAKAVSDLEKCIELSADSELAKAAQQALRKIENPP